MNCPEQCFPFGPPIRSGVRSRELKLKRNTRVWKRTEYCRCSSGYCQFTTQSNEISYPSVQKPFFSLVNIIHLVLRPSVIINGQSRSRAWRPARSQPTCRLGPPWMVRPTILSPTSRTKIDSNLGLGNICLVCLQDDIVSLLYAYPGVDTLLGVWMLDILKSAIYIFPVELTGKLRRSRWERQKELRGAYGFRGPPDSRR